MSNSRSNPVEGSETAKTAKKRTVSLSVVRRMPRYYRYLNNLLEGDITRISSRELARRTGLTASQIRQDLNCFGGFGQQGYGYDVDKLYHEIGNIIGVEKSYDAILIGCGNLGRAVAIHLLSQPSAAFRLRAAFDRNPMLIGANIYGLQVFDPEELAEYCAEYAPKAAFLCLPTENAKSVVDVLYASGVRYYWNFTHYDISLEHPDTTVENVHLTDSLLTLCYHITVEENQGSDNT
ncbi:MAG: redox-sensing transcriptional repressor Rex [Ruminococcaceae bacterium]|nr:redox-sensing transcriptional repressor Rex [Oscillospiraceae bacterium]